MSEQSEKWYVLKEGGALCVNCADPVGVVLLVQMLEGTEDLIILDDPVDYPGAVASIQAVGSEKVYVVYEGVEGENV